MSMTSLASRYNRLALSVSRSINCVDLSCVCYCTHVRSLINWILKKCSRMSKPMLEINLKLKNFTACWDWLFPLKWYIGSDLLLVPSFVANLLLMYSLVHKLNSPQFYCFIAGLCEFPYPSIMLSHNHDALTIHRIIANTYISDYLLQNFSSVKSVEKTISVVPNTDPAYLDVYFINTQGTLEKLLPQQEVLWTGGDSIAGLGKYRKCSKNKQVFNFFHFGKPQTIVAGKVFETITQHWSK